MEIPEGWVLVPIEPTREMVAAATERAAELIQADTSTPYVAEETWQAILAAAPPPPVSSQDGE